MRNFLLLIMVLISGLVGFGQTSAKIVNVYAFEKSSASPIKSRSIHENNTEAISKPQSSRDYIFYVEYKKGKSLTPAYVWIDGQAYALTVERNIASPVIRKTETVGNNWQADTLVKKTKNALMKLTLGRKIIAPTKSTPVLSASQALLVYNTNAGKQTYQVKEIRILPADILQ